jgi:hypothetical protein
VDLIARSFGITRTMTGSIPMQLFAGRAEPELRKRFDYDAAVAGERMHFQDTLATGKL